MVHINHRINIEISKYLFLINFFDKKLNNIQNTTATTSVQVYDRNTTFHKFSQSISDKMFDDAIKLL